MNKIYQAERKKSKMSYYCINIFETDKEILKPYLDETGMLIPDKIIPVPKEYREIVNGALEKGSYSIYSSDEDYETKQEFREWQIENWETTNLWITVHYFISKDGKAGFAFETNGGSADELVLKIIENNPDKEIIVRTVTENSAWSVEKHKNGKTQILNKNKMFEEYEAQQTEIEKYFSSWEEWNYETGSRWYNEFDKLCDDKNYIPKFNKLKDEWFE